MAIFKFKQSNEISPLHFNNLISTIYNSQNTKNCTLCKKPSTSTSHIWKCEENPHNFRYILQETNLKYKELTLEEKKNLPLLQDENNIIKELTISWNFF